MSKNELIIELGAEGGGISLFGLKIHGKWHFSRRVIDQTPEMLGEDWVVHQTEVVDSFESAIKLLDQYPWFHLKPMSVHPDFRQVVYDAMLKSCQANGSKEPRRHSDWRHVCGVHSGA